MPLTNESNNNLESTFVYCTYFHFLTRAPSLVSTPAYQLDVVYHELRQIYSGSVYQFFIYRITFRMISSSVIKKWVILIYLRGAKEYILLTWIVNLKDVLSKVMHI